MTIARRDNGGSDFGKWLREQPEIESHIGYSTTDIDAMLFLWDGYKIKRIMFIEVKIKGKSYLEYGQKECFKVLDEMCRNDPRYAGIHLLVFQNTSPDNGLMWLDNRKICRDELISFLRFETDFNPMTANKNDDAARDDEGFAHYQAMRLSNAG